MFASDAPRISLSTHVHGAIFATAPLHATRLVLSSDVQDL
jgi:hypothetical protein